MVISCFLKRRSYAAEMHRDATNEQSATMSCLIENGDTTSIILGAVMNDDGRFHDPKRVRCRQTQVQGRSGTPLTAYGRIVTHSSREVVTCFADNSSLPSGSVNGVGNENCSLKSDAMKGSRTRPAMTKEKGDRTQPSLHDSDHRFLRATIPRPTTQSNDAL